MLKRKIVKMLNINEISDNDWSIYSDLHKDAYGFRPRNNVYFENIEEFKEEIGYLSTQLEQIFEQERDRQAQNYNKFISRLFEIRKIVSDCSWKHAIEILADSEDMLEDTRVYGYECLEHHFGLKYDSIQKFLDSVEEQL